MTGTEAIQLGVCLLFPLSYVGLLLWTTGQRNGHPPRRIILALAGVVVCVLGVVAVGLGLSASRGSALFDFQAGSPGLFGLPRLGVAEVRTIDVIGIAVCAGLLILALKSAKGLTTPTQSAVPEGEDSPSEETQ
jgi:hypothetical protein